MNGFTFSCIFIALICIEGIRCKIRRYHDDGKIVGGNETSIERHPYQAFLLLYDGRDYYQCGGSIVSAKDIVTAAHCLSRMQKIYVRIGSTNSSSGGTQYETSTFYSHPRYNSRTSDYDAGVVKVLEGMNLDGISARAISMVNLGYNPRESEIVILTGWGATEQNGNVSPTLRVAKVPVVSRVRCNQLLRGGITSRMFCAGLAEGETDTCQGDSGGPAVASSNTRLAGITSFGYGCAQPNAPGVYALVGNIEIRLFIKLVTGL